jgi:hypothetical protein
LHPLIIIIIIISRLSRALSPLQYFIGTTPVKSLSLLLQYIRTHRLFFYCCYYFYRSSKAPFKESLFFFLFFVFFSMCGTSDCFSTTLEALNNRRRNYIRRYVLLIQESSQLLFGILNSIPMLSTAMDDDDGDCSVEAKVEVVPSLESNGDVIDKYDTDYEHVEDVEPYHRDSWSRAVLLTQLARPLYNQLSNLEAQIATLTLFERHEKR